MLINSIKKRQQKALLKDTTRSLTFLKKDTQPRKQAMTTDQNKDKAMHESDQTVSLDDESNGSANFHSEFRY